jgi:hypothetical protein
LPDALPLKRQTTIFHPESGDFVRMQVIESTWRRLGKYIS